jgi:DNA-binding transcriptional regulator GbsR (MarR family)
MEPEQKDPLFDYIERFASLLITAGMPPMASRVCIALMVAPGGRMSAADLSEMLRISPAAVSGAVRYLAQLGMVSKERVPGSRRDHYRMPVDTWQTMMRLRDQIMHRWTALMREGIDLVGRDTPTGQRMAEHAAFFEFVSAELASLVERWESRAAANQAEDQVGTTGNVNGPPR